MQTISPAGLLIPILFAFLFSATLSVFTWQRRSVTGARSFAVLLMLEAIWIACIFIKLMLTTLAAKIAVDNVRWITSVLIPLAMLSFSFEYTGTRIRHAVRFWAIMLIVPLATLAMVFTNPAHGLAFSNQRLEPLGPFTVYTYGFGPAILAGSIYNYTVVIIAFILMASFALRQSYLYRVQMLLIVLGLLLPAIGTLFTLSGYYLGPLRDMYPYTTLIANICIAIALFSFHLFDIVPIAREQVFDNMRDGVIVVDSLGRLVDINPAACRYLGQPALRAYGQPLSALPPSWAAQVSLGGLDGDQRHDLVVADDEGERFYELVVTSICNTKSRTAGHLILLRDVSAQKRSEAALQRAYAEMESRVRDRTEQLSKSVQRLEEEIRERQRAETELRDSYDTTLEGWSRALELRERETAGHSRRVVDLTVRLAEALGVPAVDIVHIRRGAILHDIGKMGVPDSILLKPGPLEPHEWEIMRQHPLLAYNALSRVAFLSRAIEIPYCHHECWDGSGYPRGLRGEEIPLAARLFAVIDVWDALNSQRPYRPAWPPELVLRYLREQSGRQFDPHIVPVFLQLLQREGLTADS